MIYQNKNEEVQFLKQLWRGEPTLCPKCGEAQLTTLHTKAKKSNCNWKCPECGAIYRTIRMLKSLTDA